jgi:hypothetical protein
MKKLNIFTVEDLIFKNKKAEKILWNDFSDLFKEYIFIKRSGITEAVLSKLYMKFFERFYAKKSEYIEKIFGNEVIEFSYNKESIVHNINYNILNDKIDNIELFNNINNNYSNLDNIFLHIFKKYPNLSLYRRNNEVHMTFWK